MHNDPSFHHGTMAALYAAMACAMTAGLDHGIVAGLYLIVALAYWGAHGR